MENADWEGADKVALALVDWSQAHGLGTPARPISDSLAAGLASVRSAVRRGASIQWAVAHSFSPPVRDYLLSRLLGE